MDDPRRARASFRAGCAIRLRFDAIRVRFPGHWVPGRRTTQCGGVACVAMVLVLVLGLVSPPSRQGRLHTSPAFSPLPPRHFFSPSAPRLTIARSFAVCPPLLHYARAVAEIGLRRGAR